jgi:16S rRNA (guanine527-N7)-methyltransferase
MELDARHFREILYAACGELRVPVSEDHAALLFRHAQLLMEWNRRINLTAIVDPVEVVIKHYIDALAPIDDIPKEVQCLDIGTGAGFPGIPLKILRPSQPLTLIDSVRKKISFVKYSIMDLQLTLIDAIHIRAEDLARIPAHQKRYGAVLCRALADLPTIIRWAKPFLAPGGKIVAWRGPDRGSDQIKQISQSVAPNHISIQTVDYALPILGDRRTLLVIALD